MKIKNKNGEYIEINDNFRNPTEQEIKENSCEWVYDWSNYKYGCFAAFRRLHPEYSHISLSEFDQNIFYGEWLNSDGSEKQLQEI